MTEEHQKPPIEPAEEEAASLEKPRDRKRRLLAKGLYMLLIVVCVVVFSWTGYAAAYVYPLLWGDLSGEADKAASEGLSDAEMLHGQLTIVLLGTDKRKSETMGRSDTLMVAFIDVDTKRVRLLSIPRDSYVEIPDHGKTKINHAYAYGGVDLTLATLEHNFGITTDYYAQIDFKGFREVINAIGGVTIDVPKKMYLAKESIDLEPGLQTLDGKKALQFVRYRDEEGDLGRVRRQQQFMTALKDQVMSVGTMLSIPDICTAIMDNVVTNMSGNTLLKLAMSLGSDLTLETYQPEGDDMYGPDGISYFYLDETATTGLIEALVNFEDTVPETTAGATEIEDDLVANPNG